MSLAKFKLGLPVFRYAVHVRHATPRTATPFEAVVLDIIQRFGSDPGYRDWKLETVFEEMLRVPDPRPLLTATLQELLDLRILASTAPLHDSRDVTLGMLSLTERGKAMVRHKKLHGRAQEHVETFVFDPVAGTARRPQEWARVTDAPPALALAPETVELDFPEQDFLARLEQDRPDWYRGDTEIEEDWCQDDPETGWETATIEAELAGSCLRYKGPGHVVGWLDANPGEALHSAIVDTLFHRGAPPWDQWPLKAPGARRAIPVPGLLAGVAAAPLLFLSDRGAQALEKIGAAPQPQCVRLQFRGTGGTDPLQWEIRWNATSDGCTIAVGLGSPPGDWDVATPAEGWTLAQAAIRSGDSDLAVPLALEAAAVPAGAAEDVALRLLASPDSQHLAAGLLLTPAAQALHALLRGLASRTTGLGLLTAMREWKPALLKSKGPAALANWHVVIGETFNQALSSRTAPLNLSETGAWCTEVNKLGTDGKAGMLNQLVNCIGPVKSAADLKTLTATLRKCVQRYNLPVLPNLYAPQVVREVLDAPAEPEACDALNCDNTFDNTVRELWRKGTAIARRMGGVFPFAALEADAGSKLGDGRDLAQLRTTLAEWTQQAQQFLKTEAVQPVSAGSRLADTLANATQYLAAIDRHLDATGASFDYVFVVDTNAFINCPGLAQHLRENQLLVLANTVIDELDKKKTDAKLRGRCAAAVRNLHAVPESRIRFEEADRSRVSADYRDTNDTRILSVAAKYVGSNLFLVTDDKELLLKAKGMNIQTSPVARFMDYRPAQQARSQSTPGPGTDTTKKRRAA